MEKKVFMTTEEVAARWNVTRQTLQVYRRLNRGPAYIRLGNRYRYHINDIKDYEALHQGLLDETSETCFGDPIPEDTLLITKEQLMRRWKLTKSAFTTWARYYPAAPYTTRTNIETGEEEQGYSLSYILELERSKYSPCQSGDITAELDSDTEFLTNKELVDRWQLTTYTLQRWAYMSLGPGIIKLCYGVAVYPLPAIYAYETRMTRMSRPMTG